ncbi:NAD(P)-dependent oxidoreductase [Rhodococcoides yunnanense]|uniref:NAD(P)-dependent oxidoreductase n=1 Tax=Rhodococcoides yunnanense TaxID=278209 RepID=UPI0009333ABE|nr:NAD(P)H-binding protein [Rhodococcus yunnanensis]
MTRSRIIVLGAGGRAGSAIVDELRLRGRDVVAVVRDTRKHARLAQRGVELREGDAADSRSLEGATAVIDAVSPFSAPPPNFDDFDGAFYEKIVDAVAASADGREIRFVAVGLAATLPFDDGNSPIADDTLFPAQLRPFAQAHVHRLERLSAVARIDWVVVTPPARLSIDGPAGDYTVAELPVAPASFDFRLSYRQLARAVVDQVLEPTVTGRQVLVHDRSA